MYTISEIARLTGISAYTLRYYEKIGVLPDPTRQEGRKNGIRRYSDQDLRFIRFIHGLKQTGMKLEGNRSICTGRLPVSRRLSRHACRRDSEKTN